MAEATVAGRPTSLAVIGDAAIGLASVVAAATAWVAASTVRVPVESDYGLVAVLPPAFWGAAIALNVAMVVALYRGRTHWTLMALLQLCLVVVVYVPAAVVARIPRTEPAYRHIGIAGDLLAAGRIDPAIDAYYNWPGFFAGLSSVLSTSGIDPVSVALWAPLVNGSLWLCAVALVIRSFTDDPARLWLALWLFTSTNWIDQDYLSPQAFAYFLYLTIVALLLTDLAARPTVSFKHARTGVGWLEGGRTWWRSRRPTQGDPARRVRALLVVSLLSFTIVMSHQLTPLALLLAVSILALAGRTWAPGLALLVLTAVLLWFTTGASTYLVGHPVLTLDQMGSVASRNLSQRLDGSPGHIQIARARTAFTAAMWLLAAAGTYRLWRERRLDSRSVLLFLSPFLMVPLNPYGGEMLLRATLLAAPFTALLAASALASAGRPPGRVGLVVLPVLLSTITVALVAARYGNARFDMFTQDELRAARAMYAQAPPQSVLLIGASPAPWQFEAYGSHPHASLVKMCPADEPLTGCLPVVQGRADFGGKGAMVMITRSSEEVMRMLGDRSPAEVHDFERRLQRMTTVRQVYANSDARVYEVSPQEPAR